VQLRDHPLMILKSGYLNWPPVWTTTHPRWANKPTGEVGTLEDVMMSNLIDNKIFIFMQYQDSRYMGFVAFVDSTFCGQIYDL
jgi:hypothetical protein